MTEEILNVFMDNLLVFLDPPTGLSLSPSNAILTLRENSTSRVNCTVQDRGNPPANATWMLNNQVISVGTNAVLLQLTDVQYSSAAREYICRAENQFNSISQSFALIVQSKHL